MMKITKILLVLLVGVTLYSCESDDSIEKPIDEIKNEIEEVVKTPENQFTVDEKIYKLHLEYNLFIQIILNYHSIPRII